MPIAADLHAHSTASDGEWDPEAVVDAAAEAGLKAFALTDHDTLAGVARAQARGKERGVEVVAGCELTAYLAQIELHILAYFVALDPGSALQGLLERVRLKRRERALEMGAKLRAAGVAVDDADILAAAGPADSIGQPHVAAALVKRGAARTLRDAIKRHLRRGTPGFVPKARLEPHEVFRAVHEAGGLAVLAHPGLNPHDELVSELLRQGLDGLEAFHASHSSVDRRYYSGLARRHELVISGGSDFHGPRVKPGIHVGCSGIPHALWDELKNYKRRVTGDG